MMKSWESWAVSLLAVSAACSPSGRVCDLKLESSARHPQTGSQVSLQNIVVTTPTIALQSSGGKVTLGGFFVQDADQNKTFEGAYSGVLVTYDPTATSRDKVPQLFENVQIDGVFDSMGSSDSPTKVVRSSAIQRKGNKTTITPVAIDRADLIGTGGEKAAAYEGVLVRLREVSITDAVVTANGVPVDGAFRVNQSLVVDNALYPYPNARVDDQFTSLGGVLHLAVVGPMMGQSLLTPRFATDVVDKNATSVVSSIVDINDPNAAGHPLEGCQNLTGSQTVGKCATAHLTNVVVTAANGYVSSKLRAFWVQDDSVPDGKFAGIEVTYNPANASYIPNVGDRVNVDGQIIEYKRARQIQYPTVSQGMGDSVNIDPVEVSPDDVGQTVAPETNPYQGTLVRVSGVKVTTECVEDTKGRDHGDFIVADEVYIGGTFSFSYHGGIRPSSIQCLTPDGEPTGLCGCASHSLPGDQRKLGDSFRSIAGIMTFAFNLYQMEPRGDGDLVQ
jgi:hypothetical protein